MQRWQLRREALIRAEENTEAARRKAEQSAQLRSRLDDNDAGIPPIPQLPEATPPPAELEREATAETEDEAELTDKQMEELRRLVSEWESRNQSRAREMLENRPERDDVARETLQEFLDQNPEQQR
ncbi:MAG: hypothetical protein U5P41_00705 [Gammaproteobacteria bacterium]|nr:hypothetical protein [Gammaproteobacteria bacterium]